MKKLILSTLIAIGILTSCTAQNTELPKESLSKKLTTKENTEIKFKKVLKEHLGRVTVIEVWASWCSDCVKAMPKVKELQANNPDVDYVFISLDKTFDKWQAAIEKHELKGEHYWVNDPKLMKGAFGKSINLDWVPRYIVINKKGEVEIYRAIETDFEKINETLKKLQK